MAVAPPSGETLVRTMAERGSPTTREQGSDVAAKAYKELQQKEGPRKVIDIVAARKEKADEKSSRKTINENIGEAQSDRVTGNKTRTTAEQGRFDRASKAEDLNLKFLKEGKGYENLSATERQIVRRSVAEEMRQWPGVEDLLVGKTPAERNAMIDEWLKDPAFFDKVKDLHGSRVVSPEKTIGSEGESNEQAVKDAEKAVEAKKKEIDVNQDDQKKQDGIVESFADKSATGGVVGDNAQRLNKIDADLKASDYTPTGLQTLRREQMQLDQKVKQLNERIKGESAGGKFADKTELGRLRGLLDTAESQLDEKNGKLKTYDELIKERENLGNQKNQAKTKYEQLTEEHNQKTLELEGLERAFHAAKIDLEMIGKNRAEAEEDFVKSTEDIFKDALGKLWIERATLLQDEVNKRIDAELADPSIDLMTRKLLEQTKVYWDKLDVDKGTLGALRKGGKVEVKTDKDKLDRSIDHLSRFGDETLIRDILYEAKNPETGNNFTVAEVDAKIAADPDFVKNNKDAVVNALVSKGLVAKRLDQKKLDLLVSKGLVEESQLIDIINNNAEVKKAFEKSGMGAAQIEWLKKNKKVGWWLLLMLLAPGLGSVVGAGVLTTKIVKGQFGGQRATA